MGFSFYIGHRQINRSKGDEEKGQIGVIVERGLLP